MIIQAETSEDFHNKQLIEPVSRSDIPLQSFNELVNEGTAELIYDTPNIILSFFTLVK